MLKNQIILQKITDPTTNTTRMKKTLIINDERGNIRFLKGVNSLNILSDNPNVTKIYSFKEGTHENSTCVNIITEYCENGDILKCGQMLKHCGSNFSGIAVYYMKKLIKFFAYLQQVHSLSHRDIKPQNILVTANWDLKIGDFESSTSTIAKDLYTIQGSPYYLSPELRKEWINWQTNRNFGKAIFSPYLSDTYSLGLVLLYINTLKEIDEEFCDFESLEENINLWTDKIENECIRVIVKQMLTIDSNYRPDFVKLRKLLEEIKIFQCSICSKQEFGLHSSCTSCYRDYHIGCITSDICSFCKGPLECYCINCPNLGFKLLKCLHPYCTTCRTLNTTCFTCLGIDHSTIQNERLPEKKCHNCPIAIPVNEIPSCGHELCNDCRKLNTKCLNCNPILYLEQYQPNSSILVMMIKCSVCLKECSNNGSFFFCYTCQVCWCISCKRKKHAGKCVDFQGQFNVLCLKCNKIACSIFDEVFFECKQCGYRCIVCMKSAESNHEKCISLLEYNFE